MIRPASHWRVLVSMLCAWAILIGAVLPVVPGSLAQPAAQMLCLSGPSAPSGGDAAPPGEKRAGGHCILCLIGGAVGLPPLPASVLLAAPIASDAVGWRAAAASSPPGARLTDAPARAPPVG